MGIQIDNNRFNFINFSLQTTRSSGLFEISPRPFAVTTSPVQNRGQFGSFGQSAARQNSFGFNQNFNFPSSAQQQSTQRQNPYLDTTGFGEVTMKSALFLSSCARRLAQFSVSQPHNALIIFSAIALHSVGMGHRRTTTNDFLSFICAT